MSTPPEMMGTPPPGPAPPAGGEPSPAAAPTMTPQAPKGQQKSSDAKVQMARRLLEDALVAHGQADAKGEKYKTILKCITAIASSFGKDEDEAQAIMPAELKSAIMAPAGEPGPAPGGGAPGGAPAMAA